MGSTDPLIFSIQHFCLHDGPGIRSLVFFKGCPLRCPWCQNVESWKAEAEIAFKGKLCIGCGTCVGRCPERALAAAGKRDKKRCRRCFTCVEACPSGALTRFGVARSAEEIARELRPEFSLLKTSGGGVTLSGGEPALYPEFTEKLAGLLHDEGIDVAMETCGLFDFERLTPLLRKLQLVLFDIKIHDSDRHKRICGADNAVIRHNLKSLVEAGPEKGFPPVWPRLPIVPGMTDGKENIGGWAGFLSSLGIRFLTLVPYHPMGAVKRTWLGLPDGPDLRTPTEAELKGIEELFQAEGITVYRPGDEDFTLALGPSQAKAAV
ncbi:MAG TPA: glycyl-radical enzyme activating protein [Deltaproteobacteria bacterium]|jgi:pyruvate formate lyase activating enzyme|nr:glycyl-radical enzyme activating protein [Deltaproteobacteria bacterium]